MNADKSKWLVFLMFGWFCIAGPPPLLIPNGDNDSQTHAYCIDFDAMMRRQSGSYDRIIRWGFGMSDALIGYNYPMSDSGKICEMTFGGLGFNW